MRKSPFSPTVRLLALTSFFTDVASEMLYPVMPMYLTGIGFPVLVIGILEGIAEAVAGLGKGYFGRLSDTRGRRLPFVRAGYALSAVSKPMMAVATWVPWVFAARALDRVGKGMRTAPRDAMLSAECPAGMRGRVFGYHRAWDTLGAAVGPLGALAFLAARPGDYRALFLLALAPGVLAVACTFALHETASGPAARPAGGFFSFLGYWRRASSGYRRLTGGLLAFALLNSSDVFLLLMMKHRGLGDAAVIGTYVLYNLVHAAAAFPLGALGDRIGFRPTLAGGLLVFAGVYAGAAFASSLPAFIALFALYGLYAGATEGISRAWITSVCSPGDAATAVGFYTGLQSVATILASSVAGLLWSGVSPAAPFLFTAAGTLGVAAWIGSAALASNRRPVARS